MVFLTVLWSRFIFDWPRLDSGSGSSSYKKEGFQPLKFFKHHSFFLTRKMSFISIRFLNCLLSMWELTKRISLRISSVLSKVEPEPEPDLYTSPGSDQKVPVRYWLRPAPQHCFLTRILFFSISFITYCPMRQG